MVLEWVGENFGLVKKPQDIIGHKAEADLGKAIMLLLQAGLISGLALAIYFFAYGTSSFLLLFSLLGISPLFGGAGLFLAILIITPLLSIIGHLIMGGVVFVSAKLLGGKGTFTQQFYLYSLPLSVIMVLNILSIIPCIGGLLSIVIGIYSLYVEIIVVRDVHQLTTIRAAVATLAVPLLVFAILMVVVMLSSLLYLGVFNLGERVPDQCRFKVGILCTSAGISASDGIMLNLQNTMGSKISVCRIRCSGDTTDTGAIITQAVPKCDGGGLGSIGSGQAGAFKDKSPDAMGCLKDGNDLSGPYYKAGQRVRGKLYLWYSEQGDNGNARLTVGDLQTTVMP
jgi:hypothetical protein